MSAIDPNAADQPTTTADMTAADRRSARNETLRSFLRSPSTIIGMAILAVWILCAILGENLAPYDPYVQDFDGHIPPGGGGGVDLQLASAAISSGFGGRGGVGCAIGC